VALASIAITIVKWLSLIVSLVGVMHLGLNSQDIPEAPPTDIVEINASPFPSREWVTITAAVKAYRTSCSCLPEPMLV
jgi:hypothetical protein